MSKPAFLFILLLASFATAFAQTRITVSPESTVDGEMVELRQIAKVSAETIIAERLGAISLGYAPGVGMSREISISNIVLSLKTAGFSESEFTISAPPRITVRRASQAVDRERIREAVEAAIATNFAGTKTSFEISRIDVPDLALVPVGRIEIRATLNGARNFIERIPVQVEIRVDGRLVRTISAMADVEIFADVYVAISDIAAGKLIGESDFRLERTRLERMPASYVRDPSALRSVQTVRPVTAGRPLTVDSIVAATVIKLGDPVRIEVRSGRISIIAEGEARANGRIGDRISVKNKQSGEMRQAVVVDQGIVRINI